MQVCNISTLYLQSYAASTFNTLVFYLEYSSSIPKDGQFPSFTLEMLRLILEFKGTGSIVEGVGDDSFLLLN